MTAVTVIPDTCSTDQLNGQSIRKRRFPLLALYNAALIVIAKCAVCSGRIRTATLHHLLCLFQRRAVQTILLFISTTIIFYVRYAMQYPLSVTAEKMMELTMPVQQ